jgi:hypothetical protein
MLVYGSYPPVPSVGARVTQAEVLGAWAAGETVTVVSPRSTAAHLAVRIAGPLSGHRLDTVRRHTGATRLVFCAEPHVPVPLGGAAVLRRVQQELTVRRLAHAFRAFTHVTLVVTGDLGVPARVLSPLMAAADEVRAGTAPPARGPVTGSVSRGQLVHDRAAADRKARTDEPVAALGPVEIRWQDLLRRGAGIGARRLLGSRAPAVRARVAAAVRAGRRARRSVRARH